MNAVMKQTIPKLKNTLKNNQRLFIGLAIGALVLLPSGLYLNERSNNRQAIQQNTTLDTKSNNDNIDAVNLDPINRQPAPNQSNNQSSSGTKKPNSTQIPSTTPASTYKAPGCTKTPIGYKTFIKLATYLGTGSTTVYGGTEGYTETCTADSTGYIPNKVPLNPVDKYIYVGTGGISATTPPRTSPPEADQLDRIKADCSQQLAVHGNQEAYQLCVDTLSRYFGV